MKSVRLKGEGLNLIYGNQQLGVQNLFCIIPMPLGEAGDKLMFQH
jgi:hypothetical protein